MKPPIQALPAALSPVTKNPFREADQLFPFFFFALALRPNVGHGLLILEVF